MQIEVLKIYQQEKIKLPFGSAYNLVADVKKDGKLFKGINIMISDKEYQQVQKIGKFDT